MRKWLLIGLVVVLMAAFTACGKNADTTLPQEEDYVAPDPMEQPEQDEPEPTIEPKEPELPYTAPLTGIGSTEPLDHRIIMVMVENSPAARPQSGLDKADMVYEVIAEGNITRFAAFYHSEYPDNVGPVRSIRPYYIELGNGFDAILVHAGGSNEAFDIIARKGLPSISQVNGGMDKYFWRVKFRKAPHNVYTDFNKIKEAAKALKFREESTIPKFTFMSKDAVVEGNDAKDITIKYYSGYKVGYQYDEEKQIYYRTINGEKHVDLITGNQLTTTNLFVIKTKHRVLDSQGHLAVDLKSGGEGYLFQQGKVQEVTWKNNDGVIYPYKDEKMLPYLPGKTWTLIIPSVNAEVTF